MEHKGVTFSVVKTADPNVWRWDFQVGGRSWSGKTEARLELLAVRRVKIRIDRALRQLTLQPETERGC